MSVFLSQIQSILIDSMRMTIFSHVGNPTSRIWDTVLLSILISVLSYVGQIAMGGIVSTEIIREFARGAIYRKNVLSLEGKISSCVSRYTNQMKITKLFTDDFNALWKYILDHSIQNTTIRQLKEVVHTKFSKSDYEEGVNDTEGTYMVCQPEPFLLDSSREIYAKVVNHTDTTEEKPNLQTIHYELQLYSYRASLMQIKEFVSDISAQYREKLSHSREKKRFMYTLASTAYTNESDKYDCWREIEFHTSKTFENVFFENKQAIVDKIRFFVENKEWYDTYGIPYTLGIGIYGPPGTGKTSFIKALMNMMKTRHLINIPISIIQTKQQLTEFYFESRFTELNPPNSVTFDRKIVVIEDIDCVGDIVLERSREKSKPTNPLFSHDTVEDMYADNETLHGMDDDIKQTVKQVIAEERKKIMDGMCTVAPKREECITLDDILNLWDGIIETPGRILVITSNHYHKLDSALRRPGRIDITLSMNHASHAIIAEMHAYFYQCAIDADRLAKVNEGFYSSAEIVNIYTLYPSNPEGFVSRLEQNTHV